MRCIFRETNETTGILVAVYWDSEWEEYRTTIRAIDTTSPVAVWPVLDTSHTSDKADALDTARVILADYRRAA